MLELISVSLDTVLNLREKYKNNEKKKGKLSIDFTEISL